MSSQPRLFRLAPEVIHLHATFVAGEGWHLNVQMRRQGEQWSDCAATHYNHLTSQELADTIACEAWVQLDLT